MDLDQLDAEIRERLILLAEDHTQAEIARRVGSTRNNVSRYLKGRRMPVEFAAALVKSLGLNPAWLLTGEGARYLADIAADTSRTAGDLLAMIKAMTAVSKMKLGSLAGKHHLSVLRELNDALRDFESIQTSLNESLAPVFREILEQYKKALTPHSLDRADDLRRALQQIDRLCDEPKLRALFLHLQSAHEMLLGNTQAAIEFERRVFSWRLTDADALLTEQACMQVRNMMALMYGVGRDREAAAVGRSILALAEGASIEASWLRFLECQTAISEIAHGDMRRGLPRFTTAYAALPPEKREIFEPYLVLHLFESGSINAEDAMDLRVAVNHKARVVMFAAFWLEDAAVLARAIKEFIGDGYRVTPGSSLAVHARKLLNALKEAPEKDDKDDYPTDDFSNFVDLFRAQIHRIRGQKKQARKYLDRTIEQNAGKSPKLSNNTIFHGIHCRNILELIPANTKSEEDRALRQQAADWVKGRLGDGYGFLAPMREIAGIPVESSQGTAWSRS